MYGVKGKVTEEFIANNQSTFSIATEILLTNYILNLLTQKYPYRSCPPNYEIIFFKKPRNLSAVTWKYNIAIFWKVLITVDII